MSSRPGWSDDYWKKLDKETARKLRTSCPKCGSEHTEKEVTAFATVGASAAGLASSSASCAPSG